MYKVDRVVLNDLEMEYLKFGTGSKTLVILPGLSIQSVMPAAPLIEKQYEIFEKDFTVYLFDRRSNLPEKYSIFDMADDTVKAMNKLGLKNVCLFGASQGGMIAEAIAIKYPELVEKLVLGSSACCINQKASSVIGEWIKLAKSGKAEDLYLYLGEKVYSPEVFNQYRNVLIDMAKSVTEMDLKRFIILAEGINGFDLKDKLNLIQCPLLVIGDHTDAVLGGEASLEIAEVMKNKPNFEIYMYSNCGHAAYDAAPDYTQRLFNFFMSNK